MDSIQKDIDKARGLLESLYEQLDYDKQCRELFEDFCDNYRRGL